MRAFVQMAVCLVSFEGHPRPGQSGLVLVGSGIAARPGSRTADEGIRDMRTWRRCLAAAAVHNPSARGDYAAAARYLRRRDPALYAAIRLLGWDEYQPHAISGYAFAGFTDDLCDHGTPDERMRRLDRWHEHVRTALASGTARHPVLRAYLRSVQDRQMPHRWIHAYLEGARVDLNFNGFGSDADQQAYIDQLSWPFAMLTADLVHCGGGSPRYARVCRSLAEAWQRADFLTDLHEDLRGGRLYLPADALSQHGVTRSDLESGTNSARVRALVCSAADVALAAARESAAIIEEMPVPLHALNRFAVRLAQQRLEQVKVLGAAITRAPVRDYPAACLKLMTAAYCEARRTRPKQLAPTARAARAVPELETKNLPTAGTAAVRPPTPPRDASWEPLQSVGDDETRHGSTRSGTAGDARGNQTRP
ncbi:squalene/phytoene synthase family protein [Streptomyces sp. NPDC006463]|uniref:squalene/phytoene synthase family protein n=1 Tax=Streptomyces sp. NPDC006463 TaxID=3364746 RepID=UPI0036AADC80